MASPLLRIFFSSMRLGSMRQVGLFCVVGGLALPAWSQSPNPVAPLRQAEDLVDSGHLDEALQKLNTLAAEPPNLPVSNISEVRSIQQGKMVEAAAAFAKAVAQDPKNLEAVQMEGVSLFRAGQARRSGSTVRTST